ncbi:MAG: ATPase [Acidobacteria bacterium RIFCSPLOWO2_02_FULL_67_36]|nr:MAG: ATPase [Acidobacteria bacterium RIFCSPLOWO2_02_FULL_67_36]OFW19152.1 MAG: ATPase [Acidobacteria bacterium RIFCSPLOWO2_12_FULL_66_21]
MQTMPAVVVTGARQTGKSTLVRDLVPAGDRLYLTLDDLDVLEQAGDRPDDLLGRARRITIDEIQRQPSLLRAVKRAIDERRTRGRFLLTGSANLLLMRRVSESLAGRASYLTLWPMTRREQRGLGRAGIWGELLEAADDRWLDVVQDQRLEAEDWRPLAFRGGYPTPALELESRDARATWFAGYVRTYLERDLQEISSVTALPDLRRLMRAACLRLGQLTNQTELGRDVALPQPTVHRYLNLLETSYQLVRVPAYAVNRTKRLIKTPKLYWADTGLALHLAGVDEPEGAHLENLVLGDLLVWRESQSKPPEILYWRTATGEEVDFVLEIGRTLVPIEVKATRHPRVEDARHLRSFRDEYKARTRTGLLLHAGDRTEWLAPGILSAPWWRVL